MKTFETQPLNLEQPIYANSKLALLHYFDSIDSGSSNLALLGQAGLGKTAIAFNVITPQLYALGKVSKNEFYKIQVIKLLGNNFANLLIAELARGINGVIFIDEIHHVKGEYINIFYSIIETFNNEQKGTCIILSTGGKFYGKALLENPFLKTLIPHTIYLKPYTDNELKAILINIFNEDESLVNLLPTDAFRIIKKLKAIRFSQGVQFEFMSEVLYFIKCFKRVIENINDNSINDRSLALAFNNFFKPRFK